MQKHAIKHVEIQGLHGVYDIEVNLTQGLNIIYGKNGVGKTTLLHILANLIERDIERFCHIRFDKIIVNTFDKAQIELRQIEEGEERTVLVRINDSGTEHIKIGSEISPSLRELLREHLGGRPAYLPAFRSILEAVNRNRTSPSYDSERHRIEVQKIIEVERNEYRAQRRRIWRDSQFENIAHKTILCREWFGQFVPIVRCPSLPEVIREVAQEEQEAELGIAATDRSGIRNVFYDVLAAISNPAVSKGNTASIADILNRIQGNLVKLEQSRSEEPKANEIISGLLEKNKNENLEGREIVGQILNVYDISIAARNKAQEEAFRQLKTFETSVNKFLQEKQLKVVRTGKRIVNTQTARISLDSGHQASLALLSSGERQVVTMLFSATHMSTLDGVLLIDEPELSLHIDWQRIILSELMNQAGDRQIIACTHAPEVTAEHRNKMIPLKSKWRQASLSSLFDDDDDDKGPLISEGV